MTPAEETAAPAPAAETPVTEPATKKAKLDEGASAPAADTAPAAAETAEAGWPGHTLNVNFALDKDQEGKLFSELAASDVVVLQGIGPKSKVFLDECSVKTVADLAEFKFYKSAKVRPPSVPPAFFRLGFLAANCRIC